MTADYLQYSCLFKIVTVKTLIDFIPVLELEWDS